MNWITTNIRIPEDVYMDLKMIAVTERTSVAAVIRKKLEDKPSLHANDLFKATEILGKKIAKQHKGLNLAKALREMRDEQ